MKSILKKVAILTSLSSCLLFAQTAVVDTNVLLIKKEPSLDSLRLGSYKMNSIIDVNETVNGIDNDDLWYKTKKGYIRSQYVVLEKDLPKFISSDEVNYDQYALQLIVYPSTVVESLKKLRKILRDENNLFLDKSKKVFIIYLTNFDSYSNALSKKEELAYSFPSSFITKVKKSDNLDSHIDEASYESNNDETSDDYLDEKIDVKDFKKYFNEDINTEDDIRVAEDLSVNKDIITKEKPVVKEVVTLDDIKALDGRKDIKVIKPIENKKEVIIAKKIKEVKQIKKPDEIKVNHSLSSLIENVLLNMDAK